MPKLPDWTGEIVKSLHINGIMQKELAERLDVSESYLIRALHAKTVVSDAQRERVTAALEELIEEKNN